MSRARDRPRVPVRSGPTRSSRAAGTPRRSPRPPAHCPPRLGPSSAAADVEGDWAGSPVFSWMRRNCSGVVVAILLRRSRLIEASSASRSTSISEAAVTRGPSNWSAWASFIPCPPGFRAEDCALCHDAHIGAVLGDDHRAAPSRPRGRSTGRGRSSHRPAARCRANWGSAPDRLSTGSMIECALTSLSFEMPCTNSLT